MIPWTLLYQSVGGAIITSLFYLAFVIGTKSDGYFQSGREVPLKYAKTILPSVLLLYLVPTVAMYLPWNNAELTQNLTAFWQPAPLLVNILLLALSAIVGNTPPSSIKTSEVKPTSTRGADIKHLNRIYLSVFLVTAITHISTLFICLTSANPKLSFKYIFVPDRQTWMSTTTLGLHYIFQWDFWGIFLSSLIWCWMSVLDIQRIMGCQSFLAGLKSFVIMSLGSVLIGPGAVMAIVWWWREAKLEEIEQMLSKPKSN